MALTSTRSTLMHAALAQVSPELREFDLIAFGRLRRRTVSPRRSLSSLPIELLLFVRTHLLPGLIVHFIAMSTQALQHYEISLRHLICPHCRNFYEYVYGFDVWKWRLAGPCSCMPATPHTRHPNPKQFRDRHHWLEAYLSRKSLRFRGLAPHSSSSAIWDVVSEVLKEFGCEAIPSSRGLLSRRDRPSMFVVPLRSSSGSTAPVLFKRVEKDLGLCPDYNEPCCVMPHGSTTRISTSEFAPSTHLVSDDDASAPTLPRMLDAVIAPLTAVVSILLSFLTLFFTVLCYYSRPGVLRLF